MFAHGSNPIVGKAAVANGTCTTSVKLLSGHVCRLAVDVLLCIFSFFFIGSVVEWAVEVERRLRVVGSICEKGYESEG